MVDRASDRPAYRQIADVLRDQVRTGKLGPGDVLPSVRQLAETYGVADVIARRAIGLLRNEGLIDTHPGKGSFVRGESSIRRLSSERYGRRHRLAERTPFVVDTLSLGAQKVELTRFEAVPAPQDIAERLDVPPATPVLAQGLRFHAGGRVMQLSTAYVPLSVVESTDLENRDKRPWEQDTISNLERIGVRVDEVIEEHLARMPWPEEARALQLREGVPVLVTQRTMRSGQRAVEVCDILMAADQYRLVHRIPIDASEDVRLVTSYDDLQSELLKVVKGAEESLVAVGSRSRDKAYLSEVESALRERPRLVHYRILFGPPRRRELGEHLARLLELRDPSDRSQGMKTLHIGLSVDSPDQPEHSFLASERRAVVIVPSLNTATGYDTALVLRDPEQAQRLVEHGKQLYAASTRAETAEVLNALTPKAGTP
jgi:DNA-binding GntR family transcriptional regulator